MQKQPLFLEHQKSIFVLRRSCVRSIVEVGFRAYASTRSLSLSRWMLDLTKTVQCVFAEEDPRSVLHCTNLGIVLRIEHKLGFRAYMV